MKTFLKCTLYCLLFAFSKNVEAQDASTAGGYMSIISEKIKNVNQIYINYLSAVSHGKSARKVEKLREKTVNSIFDARAEVMSSGGFQGDKTLRDATVAYLKICYNVFNEDYSKIVNMEEIAEQSYDAMEAYLLAQEKAGEKLEEASIARSKVATDFAAKYDVKVTDKKDELDLKVEKSDKVNVYYKKIFLIFFKSQRADAYLVDAINRKDLNAIEQNRNALLTYSTAGLEDIAKLDAFESDGRLIIACRNALLFYKETAEKKMGVVSDYFLSEENFNKTKKAFDAKPSGKRTKVDIDNFNKAVNDMNAFGKSYNKNNEEVNKRRNEILNGWNDTVAKFMDIHMPYRK